MEISEPLVIDDDDDGAEPKSTSALKEKKKKLKAIFRKRAHGNWSFRTTTLNSTMFKASLKINNRALAQALERKKGELRTVEAMNLKLREENQALMADVNQAKLVTERTKQDIHARLRAVSCTMQLVVNQLVDAIDTCTSSNFLKLSDALAQTESCGVVPALAAVSEVEKLPSLAPADATEYRTRAPSRILAPSSDAKDADQYYGNDGLDVDDEDEVQDAASTVDCFQDAEPPNGMRLPGSNLSLIVEQSYFIPAEVIPNEAEFSSLDSDIGFRHSNPQERRNQVIFQRSSLDSPLVGKPSKTQNSALRKSRSRSRHTTTVQVQPDGTSSGAENSDVNVRRSRSQDRRNTMIFRPSSARDNEDDAEIKKCATLRHSKSRSMCSASKDRKSPDNTNAGEMSRLNDSLRLLAANKETTPPQEDETVVDETVVVTPDLAEQVDIYKDLIKSGEIELDQCSLQFVDETILCDGNTTTATETAGKTTLRVDLADSVAAGGGGNATVETAGLPGSVGADAEETTVFRGQFVTRDRIARTPVKTFVCCDEGGSRPLADDLRQGRSVISLSDSSGLNLNESEPDRSLTKRDVPTFVPIVSSPRVSSSPAKRKSAASGRKVAVRCRDSYKSAATAAKARSSAAGSSAKKVAGSFGDGKPVGWRRSGPKCSLGAAARADAAGKRAVENVRQSRRGTYVIPGRTTSEIEYDITKEDDSVLIDNSFIDIPAVASGIPPAKDLPLPGAQCDGRAVDSNGARENRSDSTTEKNATVLMFEDMEQTDMCATTIVIPGDNESGQQSADNVQNTDSAKLKCFGAEDKVVLGGGSNAAVTAGCSEFCLGGKAADSRGAAPDVGNDVPARDVDEFVEQLSHTVKRRKINAAKVKLPAACEAVKPVKSGDSGFKEGNLQENPLKNLLQDKVNIGDVQFKQQQTFVEPPNPSQDVEARRRVPACASKPGNVVSNAGTSGAAPSTNADAKKTRSKLQQVSRSKSSATVQREETVASAFDSEGTSKQAAAKENVERLLSVYDFALAESSAIPKRKDEEVKRGRSKCKPRTAREFSKDDSFVVDKPEKASRRKRHESTSATGRKTAQGFDDDRSDPLESPRGSLLALGRNANEGDLPSGDEVKATASNNSEDVKAEDDGSNNVMSKNTDHKKTAQAKEGEGRTDAKPVRDKDLESNAGLPRRDGTDKDSATSKVTEQCGNAKSTLPQSQGPKLQPEGAKGSGNTSEDVKVERRQRKRRAAQDLDCFADENGTKLPSPKARLQTTADHPSPLSEIQPSAECAEKDRPEFGSSAKLTSSRNRKTLPDLLASGKAHNQSRLTKNTPKGNKRLRNSNERPAKTNPAPKNQSSSKTSELPAPIAVDLCKRATLLSARVDPPKSSHQMDDSENDGRVSVEPASHEPLTEDGDKTAEAGERKSKNEISKPRNTLLSRCSTASDNAGPHQDQSDRRSRRTATHAVNYREPTMNKKLRQGDPHTSTIYNGSSHN